MPSFLLPSFLLFSSDEYHCVLTCCNSQYAFCPEWKSLALLDARSASEKTQHHTFDEATEHPKGCKCRRSKCRKKCDHLLSSIWRIFAFAPAVICCENAVLGSWHDIMCVDVSPLGLGTSATPISETVFDEFLCDVEVFDHKPGRFSGGIATASASAVK